LLITVHRRRCSRGLACRKQRFLSQRLARGRHLPRHPTPPRAHLV